MFPRSYQLQESRSRPASRADPSPPKADPHLERLMQSFKDMQSELAQYQNELKDSDAQGNSAVMIAPPPTPLSRPPAMPIQISSTTSMPCPPILASTPKLLTHTRSAQAPTTLSPASSSICPTTRTTNPIKGQGGLPTSRFKTLLLFPVG
jgi:hypothetical protein